MNATNNFTKTGVPLSIAIVTIVDMSDQLKNYEVASQSVACYALHHNYTFHIVIAKDNNKLQELCPQKVFFFRRHCVAAHLITNSPHDYILFIDGDMGVINPQHRIEEYIVPNKDIIFYDRMWNFEIMAGSYLVRNSRFAITFLYNWARYDLRRSYLTDNAAIQSAVLDFSNANKTGCEDIWEKTNSVYECFIYEACARHLMELDESWKEHIAILRKGEGWTRDCWLTNSKWSPRDFMLHGWQKGRANQPGTATWTFPFTTRQLFQNLSLCNGPNYLDNWPYNNSLIKTDEQVLMAFKHIISDVNRQYQNALDEVNEYFATGTFSKKQSMKILFASRGDYPDYIDLEEKKRALEKSVTNGK